MTVCEQELCPFWAGDGGCPCAVAGISEDERRREQRTLGIRIPSEPDAWDECGACGHDRDDHSGPDGECTAERTCLCPEFQEDAA